jgi:hypothetical protein
VRAHAVLLACVLVALAFVTAPGSSIPAAALHSETLECPHVLDRPILDGVISPGEYGESFLDPGTGLAMFMQYEGNNLSLALVSPGQGWVSIHLTALAPGMPGEDLLLGYVDNGTTVLDMVDHGWEVHLDTDVGGTDDVLSAAGRRDGEGTVIEMTVPLYSSDPNDHHFEPEGAYAFRLAYNATSLDPYAPASAHTDVQRFVVGPRPPPTPAATVLTLSAQGEAREGGLLVLYSRLVAAGGSPLAGRSVSLYQNTTFGWLLEEDVRFEEDVADERGDLFGWLLLDEGVTDSDGKAEHLVTPVGGGPITFLATFSGEDGYASANATLAVDIAAGPPSTAHASTTAAIVLVVATVVGSVWAAYAFVALQIYRISRPKKAQQGREAGSAKKTRKRGETRG